MITFFFLEILFFFKERHTKTLILLTYFLHLFYGTVCQFLLSDLMSLEGFWQLPTVNSIQRNINIFIMLHWSRQSSVFYASTNILQKWILVLFHVDSNMLGKFSKYLWLSFEITYRSHSQPMAYRGQRGGSSPLRLNSKLLELTSTRDVFRVEYYIGFLLWL